MTEAGSSNNAIDNSEARLALALKLVEQLEAGELSAADETINELAQTTAKQGPLFQEVGRLTRELHEAMNNFVLDDQMAELVQVDMPDAKERLQYVIETTEKAANDTLSAIESAMPVSESLKNRSTHLGDEWDRFLHREMEVEDFRVLSKELRDFLEKLTDDSHELHNKLNDIMMAQGFQDLTGQVIKKVISLLQDVESRLVQIIRLTGDAHTSKNDNAMREQKMANENGPAVPGVTQSEVVSGQDDVDDLLSSLGF
ncbi:MAG: protein phosphatase CheZ [Gammaproteobacteria bacterium]|jgi:chemotaxis protein CheZ